jgi:predicted ferric reductase
MGRVSPAGPALALLVGVLPAAAAFATSRTAGIDLSAALAWLGGGLICVSLLLMVREPGFAGWFGGLERMYRWHHALGTIGYALAIAHPLALAAPFLASDSATAWRVLASASQSTAGILGWVAAVGLMVGLGATFAMRLPYALWRRLHATLGISVLLMLAHVYAAGGFDAALWLLIAPAAVGLGWRVLRADLGKSARPYEVEAVSRPAGRMTEVTLRPLATPLQALPGQFVMLAFFEGPQFHGCGEYHPFSVSGVGQQGRLTLTIKALGDCTSNIQTLQAGVAARAQGPFGAFMQDRPAVPELWIAGGIGIAAFIAIVRADAVKEPTQLIYLYRDDEDAAYLEELQAYRAAHPRLTLLAQAAGDDQTVLERLLDRLELLPALEVYVCGPPGMLETARTALARRGVAAKQIHSETFDFR